MFNIEDHRRYVPKPRRRTQKRREQEAEKPVVLQPHAKKPQANFKETSQVPCSLAYDRPCKCRRVTGECVQCRQPFTVTLGERADVQYAVDKGKILNYKCNRCKQYAR